MQNYNNFEQHNRMSLSRVTMGVYSVGGRDERDVAVLILATHAIRMKLRPVVRSGRRTGQDRTACCVSVFLCIHVPLQIADR